MRQRGLEGDVCGEVKRGEGCDSSVRPLRTQIGFTVECLVARKDMHAMGYHQPKPARSVYMGIVAAERWWECAYSCRPRPLLEHSGR